MIAVTTKTDNLIKFPSSLVSCADLATTPTIGKCPPGAEVGRIVLDFGGGVIDTSKPMAATTWPPSGATLASLSTLPIDTIVVQTNGSIEAVETTRTTLEAFVPNDQPPLTIAEFRTSNARDIERLQHLAEVVLLASLVIAGCSLAVSVAGGLSERQRPFSLLRLTGVPLSMLRRVIGLEAAVPLLLGVTVSAAAGLAAAALFLRAQLAETLQPPGATYYALIAAGVVASLAIIASTLPFLDRVTRPENARND